MKIQRLRVARIRPPTPDPRSCTSAEGTNQYSYRREFERTIDVLFKGELSPEEAKAVPDWVRDLIAPGMTRREAMATVTFAGALRDDSRLLLALLERM
jgi:hypothetical protein